MKWLWGVRPERYWDTPRIQNVLHGLAIGSIVASFHLTTQPQRQPYWQGFVVDSMFLFSEQFVVTAVYMGTLLFKMQPPRPVPSPLANMLVVGALFWNRKTPTL